MKSSISKGRSKNISYKAEHVLEYRLRRERDRDAADPQPGDERCYLYAYIIEEQQKGAYPDNRFYY